MILVHNLYNRINIHQNNHITKYIILLLILK